MWLGFERVSLCFQIWKVITVGAVPEVQESIKKQAEIYIFGSRFNTRNGIHNVHMNQGNIEKFRQDDGTFQDGGLLIHYKETGQWTGIFLAFASQAVHTDDGSGHA